MKIFKPNWKLFDWSSQSLGLKLTKQEFHLLKGTMLPKQAQADFTNLAGLQKGKYSMCGVVYGSETLIIALKCRYFELCTSGELSLFIFFFACSLVQLQKCKV